MKTIKKHVLLFAKSLSFFSKLDPVYFAMSVVAAVLPTLRELLQTLFLANILKAYLLAQDPAVLVRQSLVFLGSILLLLLLEKLTESMRNTHYSLFWAKQQMAFSNAQMEMRYDVLEQEETNRLLEQIRLENQMGQNAYAFFSAFSKVIGGLIHLVASALLLAPTLSLSGLPLRAAIVAAVYFCLAIFIQLTVQRRVNKRNTVMYDTLTPTNAMWNFFSMITSRYQVGKDTRIYAMEPLIEQKEQQMHEDTFQIMDDSHRQKRRLYWADTAIQTGLLLLNYLLTMWLYWHQRIPLDSVLLTASAFGLFIVGGSLLGESIQGILLGHTYLERYFSFLQLPKANITHGDALPMTNKTVTIEFRNVSFYYREELGYVLKNISFTLTSGQRFALVGENGSGKTTLVKLLCRFYQPVEGEILLNGININQYRYEDYIALLGVVSQQFTLFAFPVGENVAVQEDYPTNQVMDVLGRVGLQPNILSWENGLDTFLYKDFDTNGIEVSGGEAQRIALARAIYKKAPLILLDEPTAALDPLAEQEIYESFQEILDNKTALFISHRLSSCTFADEILVLEDGQLVQQGSHQTLVGQKGKYHQLWNAQSKYYQ